jgi:hypothetical protein
MCVKHNNTCTSTSLEKVCVPCHRRKCACVPSDGSMPPWTARAIARKAGKKATPSAGSRGKKRVRAETSPSPSGVSRQSSPSTRPSARSGARKASRTQKTMPVQQIAVPVSRPVPAVVIPRRPSLVSSYERAHGIPHFCSVFLIILIV